MAKTLGDFLHSLIKKGGGNAEAEAAKNFLLNGELVKIEIPDEVATMIDNGLISIKEAKNNHPELKNYYQKQALDGVDSMLESLFNELEIPEDVKNEVLVERSTYKRVPIFLKKIKELEAKKASADKPDKKAIQEQIDALHAQVRQAKADATKAKEDYDKQIKNFQIQMRQDGLYATAKTIYDELDPEVKMLTIRSLINKELQDKDAHLTFDENGKFVLLKKDGTNYFGDNNTQVNAQQFVDQVLSRNKILVTTKPTQQQQQQGGGGNNNGGVNSNNGPVNQPNQANGGGGTQNSGAQTFKEIMSGIQQDLTNSVPVMANGTT